MGYCAAIEDAQGWEGAAQILTGYNTILRLECKRLERFGQPGKGKQGTTNAK